MKMRAVTDDERVTLAVLAAERGRIDPVDALQVVRDGLPETSTLLEWLLDRVSLDQLLAVISPELRIEHVDFSSPEFAAKYTVDEPTLARCDVTVLRRYVAMPLLERGTGKVVVATANPMDVNLTDYLRTRFPEGARLVLSTRRDVDSKLVFFEATELEARAVGDDDDDDAIGGLPPAQAASNTPALEWIDTTLQRAAVENASDVHFSFDLRGRLELKFRVDGMLRPLPVPLKRNEQREAIGAILARCEGVDSTNTREPVDATFSFHAGGRRIDVRLAMLPQMNGPTVVLRLLDPQSITGALDGRGLDPYHVQVLRESILESQGMVVVTGPTGSGKSTTLYTLLGEIDAEGRNVHTVEDPVEYRLPHIHQTPIRSDLGDRSVTFARALRSLLRLDPDVLLVGEVRDSETAKTALDASITGHLVLTTLHTNDAIQTVTRLVEMGAPRYLVSEAVSVTVSQRLIRTVHQCASRRAATDEERRHLARWGFADVEEVAEATGCDGCNGSGYKGRRAVMEVLVPSRKLRNALSAGAGFGELLDIATADGYRPMMADGLRHVAEGSTTLTEVRRVLAESQEASDGAA